MAKPSVPPDEEQQPLQSPSQSSLSHGPSSEHGKLENGEVASCRLVTVGHEPVDCHACLRDELSAILDGDHASRPLVERVLSVVHEAGVKGLTGNQLKVSVSYICLQEQAQSW